MSADADPVRVTSLASGGAGVGRLADGMTVFVPRTAPGDLVRLAQVRRHRRHADARLGALLEPGPDRVTPPCPHVVTDDCGGCHWQHLSAPAQAAAKRRIVGDALRRIGKFALDDPELVPSPSAFGYRDVLTLTVRRRAGRILAGFHAAAEPDTVFMLDCCHIAHPQLQRLWAAVRDRLDSLPPGEDVRLKLRRGRAEDLHLVVAGGSRAWSDGEPLASAAAAAGLRATVWWHPAGGAPRRVGGPAGDAADVAFAQINRALADRLHADAVGQAVGGGAPSAALDLYAGAGDTAIPLAARGCDVTMVELDEAAVRRAGRQAESRGLRLVAIAGRVEAVLDRLPETEVVLLNPPRAGLHADVAAHLAARRPSRLVYVSCDPATLARDLRRLGAHDADLRLVRAYDMFPQTSHVETLVVVEPA